MGRQNPAPPDAAVGGPYYSDCRSNLHIPAVARVRIFPLLCEADGDAFKHRLRLGPDKAVHQVNEGSEVPTLIKKSVELILVLLAIIGLQALIKSFGLVGDGGSIHDTHVVNTVRPLHS